VRRGRLDEAVKSSFDVSRGNPGTYGSPRVFEGLIEDGWKVSINTVAASMVRQGLQGRSPKRKRRSLTRPDKAAEPIADLFRCNFTAETIDEKWRGDLTEIPTGEGKLYSGIFEDLALRRVAGLAIGAHLDAALAEAALCAAAAVRGGHINEPVLRPPIESGHYTGDLFATAWKSLGDRRSMGRVGPALGNAVAESFNSTLEWELLSRNDLDTKKVARCKVARFIETYNNTRRHSSCEMELPTVYEQLLADRNRHNDTSQKRAT